MPAPVDASPGGVGRTFLLDVSRFRPIGPPASDATEVEPFGARVGPSPWPAVR